MKKLITFGLLMLGGTVLILFSWPFHAFYSGSNEYTNNENNDEYHSSRERLEPLETLDDYVRESNLIVKGKVKEKEPFNERGTTYEYVVEVQTALKGENNKLIHVYGIKNELDVDGEYILFLEGFNSQFVDYPLYNTIDNDSSIPVIDDELQEDIPFIEANNVKNFIEHIQDSEYITQSLMEEDDHINDMNTQDLVDLSDIIAKIVPTEVITENKHMRLVNLEVKENYKNKLDEKRTYLLPADISLGEEYVVFFKRYKEDIALTTRDNSMIHHQDEEWSEIMHILEK